MKTLIALVGDYNPDQVIAHRAIPLAIAAIAHELDRSIEAHWITPLDIANGSDRHLPAAHAVWCVPGSPYSSMEGALTAIRHARSHELPFLGTCGGFQHAMIEYARSVWGIEAAEHAESTPNGTELVISQLACSLVDVSDQLHLTPNSRLAQIYGSTAISEEYRCNYGLNPKYSDRFETGPLRVSARDRDGEIRAVELMDHPFFIATLFQPERAALKGATPALVRAFVAAAVASASRLRQTTLSTV